MSFTISHRQVGVKRADAAGLFRHSFRDLDRAAGVERRHSNERIRPGLTGFNESMIWDGNQWAPAKSTDEIVAALDARLSRAHGGTRTSKKTGQTTKVAVGKNSRVVREIVLQPDPEWSRSSAFCLENQEQGDGQHADAVREYLADMVDHYRGVYGDENLLAYSIHWDETSPHMHLYVTPIDESGCVRQASFIADGRGPNSAMAKNDRALRAHMIERGHDIDPEPRRVRQTNLTVDEYARYAAEKDALAAQAVEIEDRAAKIRAAGARIGKDWSAVKAAREDIPNLRRAAVEEGRKEGREEGLAGAEEERAALLERARNEATREKVETARRAEAAAAEIERRAREEVEEKIEEALEAADQVIRAQIDAAEKEMREIVAEAREKAAGVGQRTPAIVWDVLQRTPAPNGRGAMDKYVTEKANEQVNRELGPGASLAAKRARMAETIPERAARRKAAVDAALGRDRARSRSQTRSRGYDGLSL